MGKVDAGRVHAKKFWLSTPSSNAQSVFELDLNQFHQQFLLAKPRKDDKIIFYCTPGTPSTDAANQLEALGYTNINYSDGLVDCGSYPNCDEKQIWRLKILDYLVITIFIMFIFIPFIIPGACAFGLMVIIPLSFLYGFFYEFITNKSSEFSE